MATKTQKQEPQEVNPVAAIAAVVVLVVIVAMMGIHYLSPGPRHGPTQSQFPAWVLQDAKQSQGEIMKLGPAEQQKLQAQYKNGAAQQLYEAYDALQ